MNIVRLRWHCSNYVGPPRWFGDFCEPDDCETDFEVNALREEWDDGIASATCPKCMAELWQCDDEAELITSATTIQDQPRR